MGEDERIGLCHPVTITNYWLYCQIHPHIIQGTVRGLPLVSNEDLRRVYFQNREVVIIQSGNLIFACDLVLFVSVTPLTNSKWVVNAHVTTFGLTARLSYGESTSNRLPL